MGLNLFPHIVVGVLQFQFNRTVAILSVQVFSGCGHKLLFLLKKGFVMVPDNVAQYASFHLALHIGQVNKALIVFGMLRLLSLGKQTLELHGDILGVDHLILGRTRMNIQSVDRHFCGSRIKILVFQLAYRTAVGSVGIVGAKMRHIKPVSPPADLFIRSKSNFQCCVNTALNQ